MPLSDRAKILASGLERAEQAVQEAPQDAGAHFAVFCNLGKRLQIEQHTVVAVGWIERAQSCAPRTRRCSGTGARLSGGRGRQGRDAGRATAIPWRRCSRGERLLRRAVGLAPDDPQIRVMLASVLRATGQPEEARMHAAVALHILERTGPSTEVDNVRTLMARLE